MNTNYEFTIDDKAMLEEIENKEPSNAFEFLKATKNIDIEYKTNTFVKI